LNFPESVFLEGPDAAKKQALRILGEADIGDRFMVTITEDIPAEHRWVGLEAVTDVLEKHGAYPLKMRNIS